MSGPNIFQVAFAYGATRLKEKIAFRVDIFFSLAFELLFLGATIYFWRAVYQIKPLYGGYQFSQVAWYLTATTLGNEMLTMSPLWWMTRFVRDGELSAYLLRPGNLWFAGLGATVAMEVLVLSCVLLAALFLPVPTLAMVSLILMSLTSFYAMAALLSLLSFKLVQVWPVAAIVVALQIGLGGRLFPIDLLPQGIRGLALWTPFGVAGHGLGGGFSGRLSEGEIWTLAWHGFVLTVVLGLITFYAFRRTIKAHEGVGL